jgi:hypothetical protein
MRGQIVEKTDQKIVVCVGSKHGASIDQELNVIRFNPKLSTIEGEDPYKMERVGRVRIKEIINVTVTATTPRHVFADGLIYHHVSTNEVIYESYPSQPCSVA